MKVLAISTSQSLVGVAWGDGDELVRSTFPAAHTGELLRQEVTPFLSKGVDLLAVDIGPGSYTGTRVGVAFSQGIATVRSIPWVGITTWQILASFAQPGSIPVTASRSGEVLIQENDGNVIAKPLSEVHGIPFGFACADPVKYGGIPGNDYVIPDFTAYLWAIIKIALKGKSAPALPVYFDRFSTNRQL